MNYAKEALHPLIGRLVKYGASTPKKDKQGGEARANLAILRRGLCDRLSQADPAAIFPALSPEFFEQGEQQEAWCVVIAALYAFAHKDVKHTKNRSLGKALRKLYEGKSGEKPSDSLELHIMAMLKADSEHLPGHLRRIISLLKAKEIGLDWNLLLCDVFQWDHPTRYVQRRIARHFYQPSLTKQRDTATDDNEIEGE